MNNAAILEPLWVDYHDELYGYVLKRIWNEDDAHDAVSSIYLRALVAMTNGNGSATNARGWLYAIARSVIIDAWRTRRSKPADPWEDMGSQAAPHFTHEQAVQSVVREDVWKAVERLPGLQAEAMTLRLAGYEHSEIGERLGNSTLAAKQLSVRACANLRLRLMDTAGLLESEAA